jgi:hypothetical protein
MWEEDGIYTYIHARTHELCFKAWFLDFGVGQLARVVAAVWSLNEESLNYRQRLWKANEHTFIHEILIKVEGVLPFLDVMVGGKILGLNPPSEPAIFWARFSKHSGWWSNAVFGPNSCLDGALSLLLFHHHRYNKYQSTIIVIPSCWYHNHHY